jgi:hypothetical protein
VGKPGNSFHWISCNRRPPAFGMGNAARLHDCGSDNLSWRAVHDGALDF